MMPVLPGPEVAVDSGGRVFIVDHRQNTIHAFGQDGRPLTDIGRKGRGPGEFYSLSGIEVHKDFLFAYDHVLKRISVFSLDTFKPRHTITLNSDNLHKIPALKETFLYTYFVLDDSTILAGFRSFGSKKDHPNLYYRMSWEGQIISDTVMVKPRPEGTTLTVKRGTIQLPFGRESLADVSEGGTIYTAWSDQFLIKEYNLDGEYIQAIYVPFQNSRVTQADIDTLVELYEGNNSIQNAIRRVDLPETWPALHTMRVDEKGHLWVSTITDERGIYKWWVINESGKVAGTFNWPGSEPVVYVRDGAIYTKKTGNKGISQILKYRMEGL